MRSSQRSVLVRAQDRVDWRRLSVGSRGKERGLDFDHFVKFLLSFEE